MQFAEPLISVIIPCYNQVHFLVEAIESVLAQTYPHYEIIVVDDGSTHDVAAVAAHYPEVCYIRQENQGTAVARNTGIGASKGSYLVFLDADDRLLPHAFETGLSCLKEHPECAFVFGLCRLVAQDGYSLEISQEACWEQNYVGMLLRCEVWHPASVIFQRFVFDSGIRFDPSLAVCSDYGCYLRVSRQWPIHCHNNEVSEYRQHTGNKSRNTGRMLKHVSMILQSQWSFVKGKKEYEKAYNIGMRNWQELYYKQAAKQLWSYNWTGGNGKQAIRDLLLLFQYSPKILPRLFGKNLIQYFKH